MFVFIRRGSLILKCERESCETHVLKKDMDYQDNSLAAILVRGVTRRGEQI